MTDPHAHDEGNLEDKISNALLRETTAEKITRPMAKIRNDYTLTKPFAGNYKDFIDEITRYVKHHKKAYEKADMSDDDAKGLALRIIESRFQGERGGLLGAYRAAKNDLGQVVNEMARHFHDEANEHYELSVMSQIDPTDEAQQKKIVEGVFNSLKGLVPDGYIVNANPRDYRDVLRLRRAIREGLDQYIKPDPAAHGAAHGHAA